MGSLAVLGISNDGANLVVSLLILFLFVFWLALIYWTYSDARRRIEDPMLVGCATAAAFFPFAGTIVYMIVRPPEYIEDKRERELEIAAAEARLASIEHLSCPYCAFDIERSFLRCPSCLRRLKEPCGTCGKPLDPRWKICPYCEADIGQAPPQPRRRERRRERPPAAAPAPAPPAEPARPRKPPRAPAGEPEAAPASGNGEPARVKRPRSGAKSKAPPAPRPAGAGPAPAAGGRPRAPADDARSQRPRDGRRPQRPADGARPARSPDAAPRQPPAVGAPKKRAGTAPSEQQAADETTAEQPPARPRTRPPAAG